MSIEEKRDVIRKSLEKGREECLTEIVHSNSESVFEGKLCTGILEYIKKLQQKKKQKELFNMIDDLFPEINDEFLRWIAKKIGLERSLRFIGSYKKWKSNHFLETRGKKKLLLDTISDEWYKNSIPSVDCRNGRESVGIRKSLYLQRYHQDIHHEQPLLGKKERNTVYFQSTHRVLTCTNRKITEIIKEKHGITLPIGTVWCYKPFYITSPSEKEKQLCLCKLCLNKRLLFKALSKRYNEMGESLSGEPDGKM